MHDKEVGKLWHYYSGCPCLDCARSISVIAKLVEERAKSNTLFGLPRINPDANVDWKEQACRDFGILYDEYKARAK